MKNQGDEEQNASGPTSGCLAAEADRQTGLSPCPFCGNTRLEIRDNGIGDSYVYCGVDDEELNTGCGARTSDYRCESHKHAAERWNTRANSREWQPIETAPRDGTRILIAICGLNRAVVALWNGAEWLTVDANYWQGRTITHWMSLPAPPKTQRNNTDASSAQPLKAG